MTPKPTVPLHVPPDRPPAQRWAGPAYSSLWCCTLRLGEFTAFTASPGEDPCLRRSGLFGLTSSAVAPAGEPLATEGPSGFCNTPPTHLYLPRWVPDMLCDLGPVAASLWAWFLAEGCQDQPPPSPAWRCLCLCLCLAQLQTAGQGRHMLSHVTGSGWGLCPTQRPGLCSLFPLFRPAEASRSTRAGVASQVGQGSREGGGCKEHLPGARSAQRPRPRSQADPGHQDRGRAQVMPRGCAGPHACNLITCLSDSSIH